MTLYILAFLLGFTAERSIHFALKGYNYWLKKRNDEKFSHALRPGPHGTILGGRYQK